MSKDDPTWLEEPAKEDFAAAASFLSLILAAGEVERLVAGFRKAKDVEHSAKDLLRAAKLSLLPSDDPHVANDLKRIAKGKSLAAILLVRGDLAKDLPMMVADGYHRICASYHVNEGAPIPCRIVDLAGSRT